tara:strand:- start:3022 stop:3534 length:513 start_codon:yes stop_codon:yes gene_type:complete
MSIKLGSNARERFGKATIGRYIDEYGDYIVDRPCASLAEKLGISSAAVSLWFIEYRKGGVPPISEIYLQSLERHTKAGSVWRGPIKRTENILDLLPDNAVGFLVWWNTKAVGADGESLAGTVGVYDRSDFEGPNTRKFSLQSLIQRWAPIIPPPLDATMEVLRAEFSKDQ